VPLPSRVFFYFLHWVHLLVCLAEDPMHISWWRTQCLIEVLHHTCLWVHQSKQDVLRLLVFRREHLFMCKVRYTSAFLQNLRLNLYRKYWLCLQISWAVLSAVILLWSYQLRYAQGDYSNRENKLSKHGKIK